MQIPADQLISKLKEFFPDIKAFYFFGSSQSNQTQAGSDFDFGMLRLSPDAIEGCQIFRAAEALADILRCDVDLIDLDNASTVFQFQVISTGQKMFASDEVRVNDWETKVYKEYALLGEERSDILKAIHQRGSIF